MSGIVGSRLNIRGSGLVGGLGTDGQILTSAGAGQEIVFETATSAAVTALNNATQSELVSVGSTTTELDAEANLTFTGSALTCIGTVTVGVDNTGHDVKYFGATSGSYWLWDEDADGVVQIGTLTVGVDDAGHDVKFFGNAASAYMLWDTSADDLILAGDARLVVPDGSLVLGSTAVTTTPAELNLIDGGTSRGTTAVASGDGILINDAGTMAMTNVDTVSTYFASHSVGGGNIVTTGALDSGSITSGFGAIDNGTSGIRTDTFTAETSLVPDASGGADIGTASLEWGDFYIADDKYIQFGSDQNVLVGYDETTTDSLKIAATEGAGLAITLMADEGDDAGDEWKLNVADGGTITLGNDINSAGTFVTHLTIAPNSTVTSSLATFAGEVQMVTLDIGGTNVSATAAEINYSDLATLGTSAASKVLSADSNNLTKITGGVYLEENTLSFDATQDWDVRASPVAQVTLTANVTFDVPSNPTTGQYISILCIQDGTGSRTIAWNALFEFTGGTAPTATTTAAKGDLFTFRYHNSHWIEVGRNLNLTRA